MKLLGLILISSFFIGTQAQCTSGSVPLVGSTCFDTQICNGCENNLCCGPSPTGSTTTSGCLPALIDSDGTAICPAPLTLNGTVCCNSTFSSTTSCRDLIGPKGFSDCPSRAFLCTNTLYYDLMTKQCPKTCNRCNSTSFSSNNSSSTNSSTNTSSSNCVDLRNPTTGVSDCSSLSYLCNVTAYRTLMTQQCPMTCGRCNSRSSNGSSSSSSEED